MRNEFKTPPILYVEKSNGYNDMIIVKGIDFLASCRHHEVAFTGFVHVGYIPRRKIIGISKIPRVVEYFLNPTVKTLQEESTKRIADYLMKQLKPKGVMVIIKGKHGCMSYRGVKKNAETITSAIRGNFKNIETRTEFLRLVS